MKNLKKLLCSVLVLALLLSCTAMAAPAGKATKTTVQLYINPMLLAGADENTAHAVKEMLRAAGIEPEGEGA